MNLIAAVDKNWAIGLDNKLLVSIPEDMKFFREHTTGKVIVMGRKTLESFPGGKPLPKRVNIVLTRQKDYQPKDVTVVHSQEELKEVLAAYPSEDVYIIGGETIYKQLVDWCEVAHITKINYTYQADAYFPNLDESKDWEVAEYSDENTYFDLEYTFVKYVRK
ncbi:dihydrofolate reductase [Eubacterium oxidoreducens]|uniref:Dihydrofolate reductase n=1 Tax=Eubacterium oxidoreducens TaxID=1732 RepID=A0A1G6C0A7_EUBOX|nr:dihydrofolate reductase [Eubacterium oxidoreducens]SDB26286.1 dihydrofolate reductase [Eubacterium oxidoreducens]